MNFDMSVDFSLTYYFLTIVSFRVGVPSILLLHKLNSCRGNYWRWKTIQGRKLFAEIRYLFPFTSIFTICFSFFIFGVSVWLVVTWNFKKLPLFFSNFMNHNMQNINWGTFMIVKYFFSQAYECYFRNNFDPFLLPWTNKAIQRVN